METVLTLPVEIILGILTTVIGVAVTWGLFKGKVITKIDVLESNQIKMMDTVEDLATQFNSYRVDQSAINSRFETKIDNMCEMFKNFFHKS
jgi:hypothetical protein